MNRTAAEKAAREIIERYIPAIGDPTNAVADIIERSCGETAWVSVDERLPEEDVRVLVWNKAVKDWEIATRDRGRFIDDTGTQTDLTNVVTYWATLPSPPTGRTEEK